MKSVIDKIGVPAIVARRGPTKVFTLAVDELHPSIRIAHRLHDKVFVTERIIFDHEFVLFLRGEGNFQVGRDAIPILPYRLFIMGPYQPHAVVTTPGKPCDHIGIHFDLKPGFPAFSKDVNRRLPYEVRLSHGMTLPRYVDLARGDPIVDCLVGLVPIYASGTPTAKLESSVLLLRAILLLLKRKPAVRTPARARQNQAKVQRVIDYIQKRIADELTTAELAGVAHLSQVHLIRQFIRWTGHTPAEYIRRARVARARQLLAQVDLSIKEIARATGFKNPFHFSRVFRQIDGLAPTFYRETILARRSDGGQAPAGS